MFRISQFAQIAQVSSRQLRFYDQLGLLQPAHTDRETGYRSYSIRQLPRLNRILALKELGLSLEQIGPILNDGITPSELRGMLAMKRAQVEREIREEEIRLRHIESRIALIDRDGDTDWFDVVTKSVPAIPFLSLRYSCGRLEEAAQMVCRVELDAGKHLRPGHRDKLIVVALNDTGTADFDLEIGYSLTRPSKASVRISDDLVLQAGELPAVETMATVIRQGTDEDSHASFGAIGAWIEAGSYEITGACREGFLEPVSEPPGLTRALVEIQFPVRLALRSPTGGNDSSGAS